MPDMMGILAETHNAAFRALCAKTARDVEGLSQAARVARNLGILSNSTKKRMEKLDITFAVCRHLTQPRAEKFLSELMAEIEKPQQAPNATPTTAGTATTMNVQPGPSVLAPSVMPAQPSTMPAPSALPLSETQTLPATSTSPHSCPQPTFTDTASPSSRGISGEPPTKQPKCHDCSQSVYGATVASASDLSDTNGNTQQKPQEQLERQQQVDGIKANLVSMERDIREAQETFATLSPGERHSARGLASLQRILDSKRQLQQLGGMGRSAG